MKSVLITGSRGFVGSHLVRALAGKYRIIGVSRRADAQRDEHIAWDFHDPMPEQMPESIDVVLHTAATDGRGTPESDRECYLVNTHATAQLLAYAQRAGAKQFVYLSTGSVYGVSDSPRDEDDAIAPRGHYAATKAAGEMLLAGYAGAMKTLCLRLFYPYGPGQRLPRLIPGLAEKIQRGERIPLKGAAGRPTVNPVFIDDLVAWIDLLIQRETTGTFNIAGSEHVTIRELARRLGALLRREVEFEPRDVAAEDLVGDIRRICASTGRAPTVDLAHGLAAALAAVDDPSSTPAADAAVRSAASP